VGTSRGILPTMDMPLPELLMVDMLLPVGYGYASARTSYGGYAPTSYGYGYQAARSSYGGYAPTLNEYVYQPAS